MKRVRLIALIVAIQAFAFISTHAVEYPQDTQEYFFASQLAQALTVSQELTNQPLWLTNTMQIVSVMPIGYLAGFETKFLKFGKTAGFTNSLLEKYVLLPPGVKGPERDYGDIMLVGASPMKRQNGKTERVFVAKANDRFGAGWVEEQKFQNALRDAHVGLPLPMPAPSLRSLSDPNGNQEALKRQVDAWIAEEERLHPPPIWRRRNWQLAGVGVVLCGVLYGFLRLVRRP